MRVWRQVGGWLSLVIVAGLASACGGDDDSSGGPQGGGSSGVGGGGSGGTSGGASGGGGTGGAPDTPPEVVSRGPSPDAAAWYGDPIYAVFSEPLDPASVGADSVTLTANGSALDATVELSADGTTVTVVPSETPAPADDGSLAATLELELATSITDVDGTAFAGDAWSWTLPLWQEPAGALATDGAERPSIAQAADGTAWVSLVESGSLVVKRHSPETAAWEQQGTALNVTAGTAVGSQELRVIDGQPYVAWLETGDSGSLVYAKRWDGTAWQTLGEGPLGTCSGGSVLLRTTAAGAALVAWEETNESLVFKQWTETGWADAAPALAVAAGEAIGGFDVAGAAGGLLAVYENTQHDLVAMRGTASGWTAVGTALDRSDSLNGTSVSLAVTADSTLVGYLDSDGSTSRTAHVQRLDAMGAWSSVGGALNLAELGSVPASPHAAHLELLAGAGRVIASLLEQTPDGYALHAVELAGAEFRYLGPAVNPAGTSVTEFAATLDARGNPALVFRAASGVAVARYNDSPEPPFGLITRATTSACSIPPDDSAAFPQTLTATGCYVNVALRTPGPELVPYDINSPLWSDGAAKRRFLVLPAGETITYAEEGSWGLPVGTIVVKEFWIESEQGDPGSLIPMETRFLVKRCDDTDPTCAVPWQGYSYQWNDAGTEGTLLPESTLEVRKQWPVTASGASTAHEHIYPTRGQCMACHTRVAGRTLGLQTAQLNRARNYGDTVDNQLRAMNHMGLFGTTFPAAEAETLARLPAPSDVGHTLETRVRSYFHSNCSHCHRPGAVRATIDFRFSSAATTDNICNFLVPGDPNSSPIYVKDALRGDGQMPPIASDIPDSRQLALTSAWITDMTTCP